MRRFLLAMMMFGTAAGAQAADMPDFLRGSLLPYTPSPTVNWQGFYVGGQGAVGESDMNFTGATQSVVAKLLADTAEEQAASVSTWPLGGKVSTRGTGFGGFVGYNSQWDSVVLGLEFSYLHGKFGGTQSDSIDSRLRRRPGQLRRGNECVQRVDRDFGHGDISCSRRLRGRIVPALYVRRGSTGPGRYRQDRHYQRDSQNDVDSPFTPVISSRRPGSTAT